MFCVIFILCVDELRQSLAAAPRPVLSTLDFLTPLSRGESGKQDGSGDQSADELLTAEASHWRKQTGSYTAHLQEQNDSKQIKYTFVEDVMAEWLWISA